MKSVLANDANPDLMSVVVTNTRSGEEEGSDAISGM